MSWQPISTAPKDQDILVLSDGIMCVAFWDKETKKYRVTAFALVTLSPTHWMPLPEPPNAEGTKP